MTKKPLYFLVNSYPFGRGEDFVHGEIIYLSAAFNLTIITLNTRAELIREFPDSLRVIRVEASSKLNWYHKIFLIFNPIILKEIFEYFRIKRKFPNVKQIKEIVNIYVLSINLTNQLNGIIDDGSLVYSYWFDYKALSLTFLKKKVIKVSRIHSGEIYFIESPFNYNPFIKRMVNNLDCVFPISNDVINYFKKVYKIKDHFNYYIQRLGVESKSIRPNLGFEKDYFKIVSCGYTSYRKQNHRMINILKYIENKNNIKIEWIHFGLGNDQYSKELLSNVSMFFSDSKTVSYNLVPALPNSEILKFYEHNMVDLFINLSISEGVPVSIMEAQSFGIPVFATNVGGVSEIVNGDNGFLIESTHTDSFIGEKIVSFLMVDKETTYRFRKASLENQQLFFDAEKNYKEYIDTLNKLTN